MVSLMNSLKLAGVRPQHKLKLLRKKMPDGNKDAYKQWGKAAANVKQNIDIYKKNQKKKNAALQKALEESF